MSCEFSIKLREKKSNTIIRERKSCQYQGRKCPVLHHEIITFLILLIWCMFHPNTMGPRLHGQALPLTMTVDQLLGMMS